MPERKVDRRTRSDHIFKVVTSQRFLNKQGLGNEVPFFICPYPAEEGLTIVDDRLDLIARCTHCGVRVLDLDLFDVTLQLLKSRDILQQVLEIEPETEKSEFRELLQAIVDPQTHLVPNIRSHMEATPHDVIFLSGVGQVYPYLRSHTVLNNLQSSAKHAPTVMFFPGDYTHALATGASLDLFGLMHDDKYYRAFNIMNYET